MLVTLSVSVSILNPNTMYLPLTLAVTYLTRPADTKVTRVFLLFKEKSERA